MMANAASSCTAAAALVFDGIRHDHPESPSNGRIFVLFPECGIFCAIGAIFAGALAKVSAKFHVDAIVRTGQRAAFLSPL